MPPVHWVRTASQALSSLFFFQPTTPCTEGAADSFQPAVVIAGPGGEVGLSPHSFANLTAILACVPNHVQYVTVPYVVYCCVGLSVLFT